MSRSNRDNDENVQPDGEGQVLEGDPAESEPEAAGPRSPQSEAQRLQAERDELYERLARLTADYQNSRRRLEAELDQRVQFANSQLIKSLLPVIDNFERALAVDPAKTDAAAVLKGLQLVHDQWMNVLRQQNVEEIDPQPGEPFDPNRHEALMQVESEHPEGAVAQVFQKGYAMRDRALRPAQVAVSKGE